MNAPASPRYRSKTVATWIALIGGSFGLHRFYLFGLSDRWAWLFIPPTLVGLYGVQRMRAFGVDDHLAWVLIPVLGLMLAATMITAIVYGLMPDERWNARFNPSGPQHRTGWPTVIGVIAALVVGAGVLMATIAFSAQRYFEYQVELRARAAQPADGAQRNSAKPTQ
jgi:hypothetical protein